MIERVIVFRARCDWPDCEALLGEDDPDAYFGDLDDLFEYFADSGWLLGLRERVYCDAHPTQVASDGYWSATEHDPAGLRMLGPGQEPIGFDATDQPVLLIDLDGTALYARSYGQD